MWPGNASLVAQQRIDWNDVVYEDDFTVAPTGDIFIGEDASWFLPEQDFQLTPSSPGMAGRLYVTTPYHMRNFDIRFDAWFGGKTNNGGGADGIVAVFGRNYSYPASYGGELDFTGSTGYGFEFDTYKNDELGDPSEEHMAIIEGSADNHLYSELFNEGELEDESWHSVRITNNNGLVRMTFDGSLRFEYDIPNYTDFTGYFGFTSATATSFNSHKIDNVLITVPARTATKFGTIASCVPFEADTVLRIYNNNRDGLDLQIDSIGIARLTGSGGFTVSHQALPVAIKSGEYFDVNVQFQTNIAGVHKSVLVVHGNGTEFITDTLSLNLTTPSLRWSVATLEFPDTHVDGFSEERISLINTGTVPAEVNGIRTTWQEFQVVEPATFPVVIPPGGSIEVVLRFAPSSTGSQNALLQLTNFCGTIDDVLLIGAGYEAYVDFSFQHNLMVHPFERGTMTVVMSNAQTGVSINEFSIELTYDPTVVRLNNVLRTNSIIPSAAIFEWSEDTPGKVLVYIWNENPITVEGPVFGLEFDDVAHDFACGDISIDTVALNIGSESPGVPFTRGDVSTTCINASCRVPGGIHRVVPPEISVAPNPAGTRTVVAITLQEDQQCTLYVLNETGSKVLKVHGGLLPAGTHSFPLELNGLSTGMYFLVYDSDSFRKTVTVLHLR